MLNENDVAQAVQRQEAAAHDPSPQVRLVAGPGTGKSYSIEGRVVHLLRSGVSATAVYGVSFTRASTADLRVRIHGHCQAQGLEEADQLRVSTLHSLALRLMRLANLLNQYPVDPRVLDDWETENWIDAEFAYFAGVTPGRAKRVREYHEAWWSTGNATPANYIPPDPPVTQNEQDMFAAYHGTQTGFWACVLPGEIVRACLASVNAGVIDPQELLEMNHLIVDEYQDLNPMDTEFIDALIERGVVTFVAGDDDQSVYSFRYASPLGIQSFTTRHALSGDHQLIHCFRCTPRVLVAAEALLRGFAAPERIPKHQVSLYATAAPPVVGHVAAWRFASGQAEAVAIAESCNKLIAAGVDAGQIMILLSNVRVLASSLYAALDARGLDYSPARAEPFSDTNAGRTILSILRVLTDADDLAAHRDLLGLLDGMGPARCLDVTRRCTDGNLSATQLFYAHVPAGVLTRGLLAKVTVVRNVVEAISNWSTDDTLGERSATLAAFVQALRNQGEREEWEAYVDVLPVGTLLSELRDYLFAENVDETQRILVDICDRLELELPEQANPDRIQVMTMHGAKGLSAQVVFVPGLEDEVFPGPRRASRYGLVLEGARLLYVALTRARAAVICSYAQGRMQHGQHEWHNASRYITPMGIGVVQRVHGLSDAEAMAIAETAAAL